MNSARTRTKKLVLIAMFIAIIFAQEEALTFIPNVQLTVLLLMVYGAVVGPLWGSVIVLAHCFLDNVFMGSLMPQVFIPMALGWECVMLLGFLGKKFPLYVKVIFSILGALIYCWMFVLFNSFMFVNIDIYKYIIADIPFEIILCCSSGISVALLYVPIYKLANDGYNFDKIEKEKAKLKDESIIDE